MSITLVQSAVATGASTAPACSFTGPTAAGNLIIAKFGWLAAGGSLIPPAGYTQDASQTTSGPYVALWSRPNALATTLISCLLTGTSARWVMAIEEWAGILAATPADQTAAAAGSGATVASGLTAATAQADELAAVAIAVDDGSAGDGEFSGPTNGFTLLANNANGNPLALATGYKILTATGAQSTALSCSTSPNYQGLIVTYRGLVTPSYAADYSAAQSTNLRQRIRSALSAQALIVAAEDPATVNHTRRAQYACAVLRFQTDSALDPIAQAVASDGLTSDASSDSDILVRLSNIWNGLAGVV